jgi:hypothetical protein
VGRRRAGGREVAEQRAAVGIALEVVARGGLEGHGVVGCSTPLTVVFMSTPGPAGWKLWMVALSST